MKRKQMQLADSRLVLLSGAKLAHCHGQLVGVAARCRSFIVASIVSAARRTSSVSF